MSQPSSNITDMLASVLEQNQTMTDMIVQLSSENLAQHFKLNRLMDDMNDLRSELRAVSSILGVNAVRQSAPREADKAGNVEAGNAQPGAGARRVTEGDDTGAGQAVQQAATGAVRAKRSRQDVAPAAPPNGTFEAGPSTSKKARKDPNLYPDPEPQTRDDASRHQQDTSGSAAAGSSLKYKAGDVVLAKVKGYPEWPGMVMDSSAAPAAVTAVQGSRPYLIRFFPDGDFVWAYTKEIQTRTSRDFLLANAKIKSGRLRSAYLIAADTRAWMAEQEKKDQEAALAGGVKSEEE